MVPFLDALQIHSMECSLIIEWGRPPAPVDLDQLSSDSPVVWSELQRPPSVGSRPSPLIDLPIPAMPSAVMGIAKSSLKKFLGRPGCADARDPLRSWYEEVLKAKWRTRQDIKDQYASASICGNNRVVFNAGGNKYRLVAEAQYQAGIVWANFVNELCTSSTRNGEFGVTCRTLRTRCDRASVLQSEAWSTPNLERVADQMRGRRPRKSAIQPPTSRLSTGSP